MMFKNIIVNSTFKFHPENSNMLQISLYSLMLLALYLEKYLEDERNSQAV